MPMRTWEPHTPHPLWDEKYLGQGMWPRLARIGWGVWIYCLVDPRDRTVRYVGGSRAPRKRFEWHCRHQCNHAMRAWFEELRKDESKPWLKILGVTEDPRASERSWIAFFRSQGSIYNVLPGGEYLPRGPKRKTPRKPRRPPRSERKRRNRERLRVESEIAALVEAFTD
jgi:hypothetical protein